MSEPGFVRTWHPDDHFDVEPEDSVREDWHRATCRICDWSTTGHEDIVEDAAAEHVTTVHGPFLDEMQTGQATVDTWNANHPPGTLVRWTGPGADPIVAHTAGPAYLIPGGTLPMVELLTNRPEVRYALHACEPVDEDALRVVGLTGDGHPTHRVQFRFPPRPEQPYGQDQADTLVDQPTTITIMGHPFRGTFVAAVVEPGGELVVTAEVHP